MTFFIAFLTVLVILSIHDYLTSAGYFNKKIKHKKEEYKLRLVK